MDNKDDNVIQVDFIRKVKHEDTELETRVKRVQAGLKKMKRLVDELNNLNEEKKR